MSVVFLLLKKFWPYILAALVILAIYWHYTGLLSTIESQKKTIAEQAQTIEKQQNRITELEGKLEQCAKANQAYQDEIVRINEETKKLSQFSEQQQRTIKQLGGVIVKERAEKQKQLEELSKTPLAKDCQGAIDELIRAPQNFTPLNPPGAQGP